MDSFEKVKAEKIHLTLTLGEVDALIGAANYMRDHTGHYSVQLHSALQSMDEAVNL